MRLGEVNLSEEATPDQSELAMLLLRVAQNCAACTGSEDFATLVRDDVRRLLPHTSLIAVLGRIDLEHLELVHVEAVDYPAPGLKALQQVTNLRNRPALVRWLDTRKPIILDPELDGIHLSENERREIEDLHLGRVAAHGVLDLHARSGSYFSFGGLQRGLEANRVGKRLQLLAPHLHQALALCHNAPTSNRRSSAKLTCTEREILKWVAAGRTNAEIAELRGRSEATIRNQLTLAFKKLGVSNRASAVRLHAEWA
jgi:DNA-binding CsgD family transcriptional regulator